MCAQVLQHFVVLHEFACVCFSESLLKVVEQTGGCYTGTQRVEGACVNDHSNSDIAVHHYDRTAGSRDFAHNH